eukprot:scaffold142541_cov36-Prasinocladus_malaysianus.AAC.1
MPPYVLKQGQACGKVPNAFMSLKWPPELSDGGKGQSTFRVETALERLEVHVAPAAELLPVSSCTMDLGVRAVNGLRIATSPLTVAGVILLRRQSDVMLL